GGYELGLDPNGVPLEKPSGATAYWGVENAELELARLLKLGAKIQSGLQDVGEGIKVATLLDPFGNQFGLIENPHFKLPAA
ncbi:MAG: VOC family protein, partial [Opitutaceae bacterium]|nr:VOC family protein [Verrucomicrobiales bacterium]